jgi:hypothetical protein
MSTGFQDTYGWLNFVPEALKGSPFYTALWEGLKNDSRLLALMELIDKSQPLPITFYTAVNFLVLSHPGNPLEGYYAYSASYGNKPLSHAYDCFRAFCLEHEDELKQILPKARLQTNEPTRNAGLLLAFSLVFQRAGKKPLNMVEVGCSAGLNLLWPSYCYCYHVDGSATSSFAGAEASRVRIFCSLENAHPLSLLTTFPTVAQCRGIEIAPRSLSSQHDQRWLRAAIWPEELWRYDLLTAAIDMAKEKPLSIWEGDASILLPDLLKEIPLEHTALVWHSYALNQGPRGVKERVEAHIREASEPRTLYRISLEFEQQAGPQLRLFTYANGGLLQMEHLADCSVHGETVKFLVPLP